jgi:uncharacterized protein (DUF433 family)
MSALKMDPLSVPLHEGPPGAYRVGQSRVLLETVIHAYRQGETPEGIVGAFPALQLADVYAVLAYYLTHRAEVDRHVAEVESRAESLRRQIEDRQGPRVGRAELERRRALMEQGRAQVGQ